MKRFGRIVSLVLVIMMAFTILAGCGGSSSTNKESTQQSSSATEKEKSTASSESTATPATESNVYPENGLPKDQQVTLKLATQDAGMGVKYLEYAIDTFTKQFPNVKIDVTKSPDIGKLVSTKAQAAIQTKNSNDMFDIFSGYWEYMRAGQLEQIDDIFDRPLYDAADKKVKDILPDGYTNNMDKDPEGKITYAPYSIGIGGLFFDKNFFKENGWNQDPKTFDEFCKLCDDIKAKGVVPMTFSGMYSYFNFAHRWTKAFEIADMNGTLNQFTENYKQFKLPQWNAPEVVESYKMLGELGKKGYFMKGLSALNHTMSQMMAINHKAAMVSTADWVENEMVKEQEKGTKDVVVPPNFEWGFMALPLVKDPSQNTYVFQMDSSHFCMWKDKPELNKKWSKEFLIWMYRNDCQEKIASDAGSIPLRKDFMNNPENLTKLKSCQKSILEYMKNHKCVYANTNRDINPKFGPSRAKAESTVDNLIIKLAEGQDIDVKAELDKAEKLLEKGIEEGKKTN